MEDSCKFLVQAPWVIVTGMRLRNVLERFAYVVHCYIPLSPVYYEFCLYV